MLWLQRAVLWMHIAMAVSWVGGAVVLEVVVGPATDGLPLRQQQLLGRALTSRAGHFFTIVGSITMVTGVIRGTFLGPIQSVGTLITPYGLTWLAALTAAGGLAALGGVGIRAIAEPLYSSEHLWLAESDQRAGTLRATRLRRLRILGAAQVAGFALVLAFMVLMGDGL